MPVMAETAKFCRERQALCHHAEPVPQVALLLSTSGHYHTISGLFNRELSGVSGVLQALLERQNSVEVVSEHQLKGRLAEYPLIVVPEWAYLDPAFKDDLVAYVKKGGNLLLVGPKSAALFQAELGITLQGEPVAKTQVLVYNNEKAQTKGYAQAVKLGAGAESLGILQADSSAVAQPAASITVLGKGKIAATYAELGQSYNGVRSPVTRGFLNGLARRLFPKPMVDVTGSSDVDVCLMRKQGKLLINLVNTSGPHQTEPIQEMIQPVGPLAITLRLPSKPAKVTLEPGAQPLAFSYRDGVAVFTVPQLDIHRVIVVE